jgi:hypothetical protein
MYKIFVEGATESLPRTGDYRLTTTVRVSLLLVLIANVMFLIAVCRLPHSLSINSYTTFTPALTENR